MSLLNTRLINEFASQASNYEKVAFLPQEVSKRMVNRLELLKLNPQRILDIGSSTGFASRLLEAYYPKAQIYLLDLTPAMLLEARSRSKKWFRKQSFVCGDTHQLPFEDDSIDFIFANLLLHWCEDTSSVINEWQRVLKPNGLLMFSSYGTKTLQELRDSWSIVANHQHFPVFPDILELGNRLQAHFVDPVLHSEDFTVTYKSMSQLLTEIKSMGNFPVHSDLPQLRKMIDYYQQNYSDDEGRLTASADVIYGHAWGRALKLKQTEEDQQEISISVNDIQKG